MKKRRKKPIHFIEITLSIFRVSVVVCWEVTMDEIVRLARRRGVKITAEDWGKDFLEQTSDKECNGVAMELGDNNTDVIIWLRKRPTKASEYGTLYHEIFHAVQFVCRSRNISLNRIEETGAYLYEYIATACNRHLWR